MIPSFYAMTRPIAFIIFEDFQILDAAGPLAAFEIAGRYVPGAYANTVLAVVSGEVASSSGARMLAADLADADTAHTLLICGGDGSRGGLA